MGDEEVKYHKITSDIDFSQLKFSKTRFPTGKRFIAVFLDKQPLRLKFPSLKIPFDSKLSQYNQLEFNVSLGSHTKIINNIKKLDDQMQSFAEELNWFKNIENSVYNPTLKESNRSSFPPTLKIKVPFKDAALQTVFYDENKKLMNNVNSPSDVVELLQKGTNIQLGIECVCAWIMDDNKYGLSWKATQIQIVSKYKPETKSHSTRPDYLFASDSEEDEEVLSKQELECLIDD